MRYTPLYRASYYHANWYNGHIMETIRINKFLASSGICARRKADELVASRSVRINGKVAALGTPVDPSNDKVEILVKGVWQKVRSTEAKVYLALNKPKFVMSTASDEHGRKTVLDLVKKVPARLFPVGRLDYLSTGLIILTNDGDFSLKISHPRYHLPKTYVLDLAEEVTDEKINQLRKGVVLEEGMTKPINAERIPSVEEKIQLKLTLFEGKNRQIRRMCEKLGLKLTHLHRIAIGKLEIGTLKPGEYKPILNPYDLLLKDFQSASKI